MMETRNQINQIILDETMKSSDTFSICSSDTHNTHNTTNSGDTTSCSCHHHENFKSSTSCTHTTNTSNTSNTSNMSSTNMSHISIISNISTHTLKSNSPAVMIKSINSNIGDIMDDNLTVLHLPNSETMDTKDVYVMANEISINHTPTTTTSASASGSGSATTAIIATEQQQHQQHQEQQQQINKRHHHHQQTLAVPKWTTDDIESADEYDSEAHTQTDEDVIIKRVLAKFNQQNKQIIRKKLSFIDSLQFFQNNIDREIQNKQHNKNSKYNKHQKSKKNKKKLQKRYSQISPERKLSDQHQDLLKDVMRRATITKPPPSLLKCQEPIITHKKEKSIFIKHERKKSNKHHRKCSKRKKKRPSHSRTITPFSPISTGLNTLSFPSPSHCSLKFQHELERDTTLDTDDDNSDYGLIDTQNNDNDDNNNNNNKHKKTATTMSIRIYDTKNQYNTPSSIKTPSISTPSTIHTPEPTTIHRKTLSHGPRLMSSTPILKQHERRTTSIVPNMEQIDDNDHDEFIRNIFIDDNDIINNNDDDGKYTEDENESNNKAPSIPPKLRNSASSSPILESAIVNDEKKDDIIQQKWQELEALNEASDEDKMDDDMDDMDDMESIIYIDDHDDDDDDNDDIANNEEHEDDDEYYPDKDGFDDDMKDIEIELNIKANKIEIETIKISKSSNFNKKTLQKTTTPTTKPGFKSLMSEKIENKNKKKKNHRRLTSAPINIVGKEKHELPGYIYRTWNYEEELSDSQHDEDDDDDNDDDEKLMDNITFGTERVFSTFAKELAITSENPRFVFESLSEICVSLRSDTKSNRISFNSPILKYERVISFLKLLGFEADYEESVYIFSKNKIESECIDYALCACQQQLIEIVKKSSTYQVIISNRDRLRGSTSTLLRKSLSALPPPPPQIEEEKSLQINDNDIDLIDCCDLIDNIDADRCQLYELIWSTTHNNNTDHKAKEIILLCYMMITTPIKFMKLLEARFFNDDHGRASYSISTDSNYMNYMNQISSSSNNPSPISSSTATPSNIPNIPNIVGQSPSSLPSSLPSLTPTNVSITFDYERIHSSYGVQKKVIHMIRIWMQKYWMEDWNTNNKLLSYIDEFVKKANKAYTNDIDFDETERNKGLELIDTIYKTIQKQKAEIKFQQSELSYFCKTSRSRSIGNNNDHQQINNNTARRRGKSLHKRKISFLSSPIAKTPSSSSSSSSSIYGLSSIPNDLLKIDNKCICNQLAIYLFNKYSSIKPRECLYQYSVRGRNDNTSSPNIKIYKDTFNNIVKWVQSSILLQQQVAKRARMIKKWIKITDELFNIRCFQGFVAVQCALASNAIYTLKDAWNQNNVLKRKHHTKFKEIKVIMSASHNFENLRRLQREAHAPLIPYFGIFCKDLIYIQEGISKRNQDGMINWNKLWRISELIKEHLQYQSTPYNTIFEQDISMQQWLQIELTRSGTLKTDHLDKMSRDVAQNDKKDKKTGRHHKSFTTTFHQ